MLIQNLITGIIESYGLEEDRWLILADALEDADDSRSKRVRYLVEAKKKATELWDKTSHLSKSIVNRHSYEEYRENWGKSVKLLKPLDPELVKLINVLSLKNFKDRHFFVNMGNDPKMSIAVRELVWCKLVSVETRDYYAKQTWQYIKNMPEQHSSQRSVKHYVLAIVDEDSVVSISRRENSDFGSRILIWANRCITGLPIF